MGKHMDSMEYVSSALTISSTGSLYMRRANAAFSGILVLAVLVVMLQASAFSERLQSATSYSVGISLSGVVVVISTGMAITIC